MLLTGQCICKILANKLESDVYISLGCDVMECIACIYQGD